MSTEIENRIVQIQFNNKDFEKNVAQTIESLNKFEKSLQLEDAEKGFKNVENAAKSLDFSNATQSVSILTQKFTVLEMVGLSAINNLVNKAMDMGTQLVKSLSVDQLTQGFTRYEQKLNSTRTMMNATGLSMKEVNDQVERLMWYTDETSYSFDNMISNVAKFTSANIDAETAMTMIMGIGNAAGLAGVNAEKASHAMDGFAKAVGRGYMDLQNWSWIRTANMDTIAIKQHFIEAAVSAGTLTKDLNGVYRTLKGTEVAAESFEATLSEKWLNKAVIKNALADFGSYSDQIYEIVQATGMSAADAIEYLNELGIELSDISRKGFEASQEYRTFTDAVEATKDAVKSGWSRTYENVFGTLEEAKELWTSVGDELYSIFAEGANERNKMLAEWKEAGGRLIAIEGISKLYEGFKNIVVAIKDGFRDMFPKMTSERLLELTKKFRDFTSQIQLSNEALFTLRVITKALLVPFRALFEVAKVGVWIIGRLIVYTSRLVDNFLSLLATGNPIEVLFRKLFGDERYERMAASMTVILNRFTTAVKKIATRVGEFIKEAKIPEKLISGLQTLVGLLGKAGGWLLDKFLTGLEMLANFNFQDFKNYFVGLFERMPPIIQNVVNGVINLGKTIAEFFRKLFNGEIANPFASLWESIKQIPQSIAKLFGFGNDLEDTSERTAVLRDGFIKVKDAVVDFLKQLTPGKVILIVFGSAIAILVFRLIGLTNVIKGIGNEIKNLISGANAVFKGLKNILNASKMVKIATAILILVGALAALTLLDPDRVIKSAQALGIITAALVGAMLILGSLFKIVGGKDPQQVNKNIKSFLNLIGGIMSIALAVAAMGAALAILSLVDIQDLGIKIAAIGGLAVGIVLASILLNKVIGTETELRQVSISFVSFGLTIATIVGALKRLDGIDAQYLIAKGAVLAGLLVVIAFASRIMSFEIGKDSKLKKTTSMLKMVIGLIAIVYALKKLQSMDLQQLGEGLLNFLPVIAALYGIAGALRLAGKAAGEVSKSVLSIAGAMVLLQYAVAKLSDLELWNMVQGAIAVAGLILVFTKVISASVLNDKQTMGTIGKTILSIALAIDLLVLAIYAIGNLPWQEAVQGTIAVSALVGMMAVVVAASKNAKGASAAIIAIAATIGVLMVALGALTMIPWQETAIATAEISVVLFALSKVLKTISSIGKVKISSIVAIISTIVLAVGTIGTALYFLRDANWSSLLAAGGAIAMSLLALAGFMVLMSKALNTISNGQTVIKNDKKIKNVAVSWKSIAKTLVTIVATLVAVGGVVVGFSFLTANIDVKVGALLAMAGSVAILLAGLAISLPKIMTAFLLINQHAKSGGDLAKTVLFITSIIGAISTIVGILAAVTTNLNMSGTDLVALGVITLCVSILSFVSAIIGKILESITYVDGAEAMKTLLIVSAYIAVMSGIMLGLGGLVTLISGDELGRKFIENCELAMAALLPVSGIFAGLVLIISQIAKIKVPPDASATLYSLIGTLFSFFTMLGAGILGLILPIGAAIIALTLIGGMIALFNAGVRALGAENGLPGLIEDIGEVFGALGDAFGRFIGSIISGFIGGITRDDIATAEDMVEGVSEFTDELATFSALANPDVVTGATNFATIMESLAAGVGNAYYMPTEILPNLAEGIEAMAPGLVAFANATKDIDGVKFEVVSEGALRLAEAARAVSQYSSGQMATFGAELNSFADNLKDFGIAANSVSWENVETATSHLDEFITVITPLTTVRGDFGTFITNLTSYGHALSGYAGIVVQISVEEWDAIKQSAESTKDLVALGNSLNRSGGVIGFFAGQSDMGRFGDNLGDFGRGLFDFIDEIKDISSDDWGSIAPAVEAIKPLTEFANEMGNADSSQFGDITYYARISGLSQALAAFFDNLNGKTFDPTPFETAKQTITDFFTVAELDTSSLRQAGSDYGSNFVAGFNAIKDQFQDSGRLVGDAVITGVDEKKSEVYSAGRRMAEALISGYRDRVKENSPPWEFIQSGKFVAVALNEGATSSRSIATVRDAGEELGTALIDGVDVGIPNMDNNPAIQQAFTELTDQIADDMARIGAPNIDFNPAMQQALQTAADGLSDPKNQNGVVEAGKALGTTIVTSVQETLGTINGTPSIITTKDGHYIVQGLTNGITSNMSAEEAAKKKAENIIAAFESGLENASRKSTIAEKEKELWEALNPNATETEKAAKEYELLASKVPQQLERLKLAQTALKTLKESGFATQEQLQQSYQTLLEEETAYAQLIQQMLELERSVETDYNSARTEALKAEYELWSQTEGLTASEGQKAIKQNELYQAQLDLQAAAVREAERAYNSAVEKFGEDTTEAYRARKALAEANLEMWNIAKEWSEAITGQDLESATKDAQSRYYELIREYKKPLSDGTVSKEFIDFLKENPIVDENMYDYLNSNLDLAKASEEQYYSTLKDYYNWSDQKSSEQESMWDFLKRQGFSDEEIYEHLKEESGVNAVQNVQNMVNESMAKARVDAEDAVSDQMSQLADGLSVISAEAIELGLNQGIADGGYKGIQNGVEELFNTVDLSHIIGEALTTNLDVSFATRYVAEAGSSAGSAYGSSFGSGLDSSINDLINSDGGVLGGLFDEIKGAILGESEDGEDTIYGGWMGLFNNLIGGFQEGFTADNIKDKIGKVVQQFGLDGILNPFMSFFGIESPSKVFMEMGQYCVQGFLLGLTTDQAKALQIIEEFGLASVDEMNGAIAQAKSIADELNDDYQPTITPTIDMTGVEAGFRKLQEAVGKKTFSMAIEAQEGIRSRTSNAENQNGVNSTQTGTTVNYTQNNYSPKALSATEVYRQTRIANRELSTILSQ